MKCRDCSRCTEACMETLLMLPFRVLMWPFTLFVRMTQRLCPQCGHPLAWHSRDREGRFID